MRTLFTFGIGALLFASSAQAASVMTYRECLTAVDENPVSAYDVAKSWVDGDGGEPAKHCMALSLYGQGEYVQAGILLEEVARAMSVRAMATTQVPDLLSQAGNAYLMANNPAKAFELFDEALGGKGLPATMRGDLLIDRSRANAALGDYAMALRDVNMAMAVFGEQPDLLTLRASAHRFLNQPEEAQENIEDALRLAPDNPEALYERGNLKYALGDIDDALEDWRKAAELAGNSATGQAAADAAAQAEDARRAAAATPPQPQDPAPSVDGLPEEPQSQQAPPAD